PLKAPKDWEFKDTIDIDTPKQITVTTEIIYGGKYKGKLTRTFDRKKKVLIMENIAVDKLPNKIKTDGIDLTAQGTPTSAYLTMRQMKLMGIEFAGLTKVKMTNIQNIPSVLKVAQLRKEGKTWDEAVRLTKSVEYATTPIEQSGHEVGTKIELGKEV